ncbi:MAG: hypothetical protein ACD_23C00315G0006 [uncultured bacterium]|nr:MAG: hypothetical protein ACD_23C00315G0006 [uncultured bacterium]
MINTVKVLGIVPARGKSKGIPRKNITPLAGRPLLAYTIEAANKSCMLHELVISTDDAEIREIAQSLGARAPFIRPAHLADDTTLMPPVIIHTIEWLKQDEGKEFDVVFVLLPTAPLRTAEDIDTCIRFFIKERRARSLLAVTKVNDPHPWKMKIIKDGWLRPLMNPAGENVAMRRQDCPPVYAPCGAAILTRTHDLLAEGKLLNPPVLPYLMPAERGINIDTEIDLRLAECLLAERKASDNSLGQESRFNFCEKLD